jgi:hypothetical protein
MMVARGIERTRSMKVGARVQTIDDYINACPPAVRKPLAELRTTIRAAAPEEYPYSGCPSAGEPR